jgi:hypothetical protein
MTHKGGSWFELPRWNKNEESQTLPVNAQKYESIVDITNKNDNAKDLLAVTSIASNVAKVAIVGLTASGVGIPLAGFLATALVIVHIFSEMAISNLNLKSVMFDTLNIISNCYILNDYLEFIGYWMKTYKQPQTSAEPTVSTSVAERTTVLSEGSSSDFENDTITGLKKRLIEKITLLIEYLLTIATEEMLSSLLHDEKVTEDIKILVNTEKGKRKWYSVGNLADRITARTIKADKTINYIIRDLSIINGYFMLIKSHFDLSVDVFTRKLDDGGKQFWKEVEKSNDGKIVKNEYTIVKEGSSQSNPFLRYLNKKLDTESVSEKSRAVDAKDIEAVIVTDEQHD